MIPSSTPRAPPMRPSTDASTRNWRRITSRRGAEALRRPISRMRSVTETNMMFMTPIPPTRSEMPATPASRMVSVRSTEVAVEINDCSDVMVKSALVGFVIAVELQEEMVRFLVGGGQVRRRAGLDGDRADRIAGRPTEDALGAGGDRDDQPVSSGSEVPDDDDVPVEVSTPTTVSGHSVDIDGLPQRIGAAEELGCRRGTEHGDGRVIGYVLVVEKSALGEGATPDGEPGGSRALHRGRPRTGAGGQDLRSTR